MSYNGNDFMKALKLAHELEFEYYEISEKHNKNCFDIFTDLNGGTWSIEPTYAGKFNLCYEEQKVSVIGIDLESKLLTFIEDKLNEQELDGKLSQDYIDYNNELWRNYGFGKN